MGTLTKNRFCTGQNFFLFLSWSLFIASWAIKVQNKSSVSKELKRKVDLHKYHLVFIKGNIFLKMKINKPQNLSSTALLGKLYL